MGYFFSDETELEFVYVKNFNCINGDVLTVHAEKRANDDYVGCAIERYTKNDGYVGSVDVSSFKGNVAETLYLLLNEVWAFARFAGTELTDESNDEATRETNAYFLKAHED